jgi:hypothetical protein
MLMFNSLNDKTPAEAPCYPNFNCSPEWNGAPLSYEVIHLRSGLPDGEEKRKSESVIITKRCGYIYLLLSIWQVYYAACNKATTYTAAATAVKRYNKYARRGRLNGRWGNAAAAAHSDALHSAAPNLIHEGTGRSNKSPPESIVIKIFVSCLSCTTYFFVGMRPTNNLVATINSVEMWWFCHFS